MNTAWECRDQADQAELYYNQPLRIENRQLKQEVFGLKRLLRENGISWRPEDSPEDHGSTTKSSPSRITRSTSKRNKALPHIPIEIQLRILSYAMTSPLPIVDPLSKVRKDRLMVREKVKSNQIAINFLATCKAYHVEGTRFLWNNNSFVFTTPQALRNLAEAPLIYRETIRHVNFRVIAKFYDDEDRVHKLPSHHHPEFKKAQRLVVHKRPKTHTLARRGFRVYAYYQLVDFLEAMLPPVDPSDDTTDLEYLKTQKRPHLLPNLERIRIDFVNFSEEMIMFPTSHLHDLASHQLGCTLNEVVLTGLPSDDVGFRVGTELAGLLKDEGLLIDHAPTMFALKNSVRALSCDDTICYYSSKVVRAKRSIKQFKVHDFEDHPHLQEELPPAPEDEGEPPDSSFHSCRTIWKKVPVRLDDMENRRWELYDRISGMPWDAVVDDIYSGDDDDEIPNCENCGQRHPGALLDDWSSDFYSDI